MRLNTSVSALRASSSSLLLMSAVLMSPTQAEIITGADAGAGPHVKVFGSSGGEDPLASFNAYDPMFTGGVRVAAGDVNGDGVADIVTGAGPGAGPHVKVFDGRTGTESQSFLATTPNFTGGIYVASGDLDLDSYAEIVTGTGEGGLTELRVFSGASTSLLWSLHPYGTAFTGGVRVATGDVNGDGTLEVITGAGPGGGPHVKIFDGATGAELDGFLAYDQGFSGGIYVAAADVNGDGVDDIVTGAGTGAGPHVRVFDGLTQQELHSFNAFAAGFLGGVRVAAGDVNGDGYADIITGAGPGAGPHVKIFDGLTGAEFQSYLAYDAGFSGGIYVAYHQSVPEPGTLVLAGFAIVGFAGWRRSRR